MEREVHSILGPLGVEEPLSRLVAEGLRIVEDDISEADASRTEGVESARGVTERTGLIGNEVRSKKGWFGKKGEEEDGGVKLDEGVGLTAFLLKFGEGMGMSSTAHRPQEGLVQFTC
jgi:hypothetical protein